MSHGGTRCPPDVSWGECLITVQEVPETSKSCQELLWNVYANVTNPALRALNCVFVQDNEVIHLVCGMNDQNNFPLNFIYRLSRFLGTKTNINIFAKKSRGGTLIKMIRK